MTSMKWERITDRTSPDAMTNVLLWNGVRVFMGWLSDDGWHDSTNRDHDDWPEEPQPTHYMPLPAPPNPVPGI